VQSYPFWQGCMAFPGAAVVASPSLCTDSFRRGPGLQPAQSNGCAEAWLHLRPSLPVLAKRKLDNVAQFRAGPSPGTNQLMQKRQHALRRRRPCRVVFQVVGCLQPTEEAVLGVT